MRPERLSDEGDATTGETPETMGSVEGVIYFPELYYSDAISHAFVTKQYGRVFWQTSRGQDILVSPGASRTLPLPLPSPSPSPPPRKVQRMVNRSVDYSAEKVVT